MNTEKEVIESAQIDNELIERRMSVNTALDCLHISSQHFTTEEPVIGLNNSVVEGNNSSLDDMTHESDVSLGLNPCDQSSLNSSLTLCSQQITCESVVPTISDSNDVPTQVLISEESLALGSDETEESQMSNSDIAYVNAVLSETLGNPVVNKYPLKHRWQLWFWRSDPGVKVIWEEALQQVCKPFDNIEDFWRLYHHIRSVQQLVPPSDYCVFKADIKPMWEDVRNINGGKWILEFAKGPNRQCNPHLDEIWLEVLLCLFGKGFNDFGEEICGAVVNIRSKEDRISVWTANAYKSVANLKIGEILKMRTGYQGKLKYEAHSTSQKIAEEKERVVKPNRLIATNPTHSRRSCIF